MSHIDIHILELLASKVCHDLISPVGAIHNGVEFMEEMGEDGMSEDITGLISYSSTQASAKLKAYRMAYGAGGSDTSIKPEDVHEIFAALIEGDKKVTQSWDPYADFLPADRPPGYCKILMCSLLLAMECLPKGGTIAIEGGGENELAIAAEGEDCAMRDMAGDALALKTSSADLQPKSVHPYLTGLLCRHYGFTIFTEQTSDTSVKISLAAPDAGEG